MTKKDRYYRGVSPTIDKESAVQLGARIMHMAEPYGVEAIAIGSVPDNNIAFPFSKQPLALLEPRIVPGWRPRATHFFFATDVENEIRYVVCDTDARRDDEIRRAGAGYAFVTGGRAGKHEISGAILFGSEISRDESSSQFLKLLAHYAYGRMMMILRERPAQSLSSRQLEVLSWAAEGKTDGEIAEILGLSNFTVDKYMRQIKELLGAVNRTAAIVTAMRSGLIS